MIRKAMILAAGIGSRLMPLTSDKPKALVKVHAVPLIDFQIRKLIAGGFTHILINVHHKAEMLIDHIQKSSFEASIDFSDESRKMLDTGGAIKKAAWFFRDVSDFLLINVDVITNLDLQVFFQKHKEAGALSTIAVRDRKTGRYLLFDENENLSGWKNIKSGEERIVRKSARQHALAFSGLHCISTEIFNLLPSGEVFSIIDAYLGLAEKHKIKAFVHQEDIWADVGKAGDYNKLNADTGLGQIIKQYYK